jgi:hypothetical protein
LLKSISKGNAYLVEGGFAYSHEILNGLPNTFGKNP